VRLADVEAQTTLHGFAGDLHAVDLLADRLYSKSVVSPANPFDVVLNEQIYSKSTACWRLAVDVL
jgi:hypothetical protein